MKNAGKACNNRLYRHIRTFEKIVKNYFVIYNKTYIKQKIFSKSDRQVSLSLLFLLKCCYNINETKENNMKYKTAQDLVSREYIFIKKENVSWQTESY